MNDRLSLLEYCIPCGNKCCVGQSGAPRIVADEARLYAERFGEKSLIPENGFWVPGKEDARCVYLSEKGACLVQDVKSVDCRMFPLDPTYNEEGCVEWYIDKDCPAAEHLSPEFFAQAIMIGTEWIMATDIATAREYWGKYKEDNNEQNLVSLSGYLGTRPPQLLTGIKKRLQELIGADLKDWLEKNKSLRSLDFLIDN